MASTLGTGVINFATPSAGTTLTQSYTVTNSGSNRALVVATFVYHSGGAVDFTGVTYNGVAMTSYGSTGVIGDTGKIQYWALVNPTAGSAQNIVATFAGGSAEEICLMAQAFQDVNQTTPLGTGVPTSNTNTNLSTGTVSLSGSDLALAVFTGYDAAGAYTITENGNLIVEQENGNFNTTFGFQSRANATLGWSMSVNVDSFQQYSIPLKDVSGGASVDPGVIYNSASVLGTPFFSFG